MRSAFCIWMNGLEGTREEKEGKKKGAQEAFPGPKGQRQRKVTGRQTVLSVSVDK